jgi:hypothetical protein
MKTKLETIDSAKLQTATGGINWGSIINTIKPYLPPNGPTIPLGPFTPPKPDPRVA